MQPLFPGKPGSGQAPTPTPNRGSVGTLQPRGGGPGGNVNALQEEMARVQQLLAELSVPQTPVGFDNGSRDRGRQVQVAKAQAYMQDLQRQLDEALQARAARPQMSMGGRR